MISRRSLIAAGALTVASPSGAQWPPIDLGIPNIPQETNVWCWAAVAEQVIRWLNSGDSPRQAELVSIANGFPPFACANPPNPMVWQRCLRPGGLHEISALIQHFGGAPARIAPPAGPAAVYQTLADDRAIIISLQQTPFQGHVVVVRGMIPANHPLFLINDPMNWSRFAQPVPFGMIAQMWSAAIVVG
jgi:hypothetical protein